MYRDLDLLRDAGLTCEDPALRWKCKHCGNRINTEEVENRCDAMRHTRVVCLSCGVCCAVLCGLTVPTHSRNMCYILYNFV